MAKERADNLKPFAVKMLTESHTFSLSVCVCMCVYLCVWVVSVCVVRVCVCAMNPKTFAVARTFDMYPNKISS